MQQNHHSNVTRFYTSFANDSDLWLVMQLMDIGMRGTQNARALPIF